MQITDGAAKQVLRVSLLRRSLYHLSSLYEQGAAFWEAAERGNLPVPSSALTDAHFRSESRNRGMQKSTPPLRGVF
ncbi:hypothetical protein, partial [Burkholderia pseudomallei]|uniref:hypothetical protein n=1 Tax=Burkholderia pseudomallei TaxID=28450 RepID=UPI001E4B19E5